MRPELNSYTNAEEFSNYYWLKEELVEFCTNQNIPRTGNKGELAERIEHYLKTGEILGIAVKKGHKKESGTEILSLESTIPKGYRNDEKHREFFISVIGEHFKFNVPFMDWMKENHGKTYSEAVCEWKRIYEDKKSGKKYEISLQFEYNQYIRDFFRSNPGLSKKDAVKCWKHKKSIPGGNKYEEKDLKVLYLQVEISPRK